MPKINFKINIKGVRRAITKIFWLLGRRAFVGFLIFFFIGLFIGGVIFYYYGFLVVVREPEIRPYEVRLDDQLYQQFLESYRQRRVSFDNAGFKMYFNPFFHSNIK